MVQRNTIPNCPPLESMKMLLQFYIVPLKDNLLSDVPSHRGVNPESWGSRPLDFGHGGRGGRRMVVGVVDGPWNIIISYHVQEVCSKVVTLNRNRIIYPGVAVNGQFLPGKLIFFGEIAFKNRNFSKICLEKLKFLEICLVKIDFLCEITWKSELFWKFSWKNRNFLNRIHDSPDFKPDCRRCPAKHWSNRTVLRVIKGEEEWSTVVGSPFQVTRPSTYH